MTRTEDERAAEQALFDNKFEEALQKVRALVVERGKGYRVVNTTPDYFPGGIADTLYEVNKKLLRARNILAAPPGYVPDGPLVDSLLDGIAYLGFAYALHEIERGNS